MLHAMHNMMLSRCVALITDILLCWKCKRVCSRIQTSFSAACIYSL